MQSDVRDAVRAVLRETGRRYAVEESRSEQGTVWLEVEPDPVTPGAEDFEVVIMADGLTSIWFGDSRFEWSFRGASEEETEADLRAITTLVTALVEGTIEYQRDELLGIRTGSARRWEAHGSDWQASPGRSGYRASAVG